MAPGCLPRAPSAAPRDSRKAPAIRCTSRAGEVTPGASLEARVSNQRAIVIPRVVLRSAGSLPYASEGYSLLGRVAPWASPAR